MAKKDNMRAAAELSTDKFFSKSKEDNKNFQSKPKALKVEKQVFSFRGDKNKVKGWRLYATLSGMKVEDLGTFALEEYIKNNPLSEAEQEVFNNKLNA